MPEDKPVQAELPFDEDGPLKKAHGTFADVPGEESNGAPEE